MDFDKMTRRINRKLGANVLGIDDVMTFWVIAGEVLVDEGISLEKYPAEGDTFRKKWIQCRVKQMSELWPKKNLFGDEFDEELLIDIASSGKEGEDLLMVNLREWKNLEK